MKPCPRKHSSVRTLLPWMHSAREPHLANPHPMEHSIVVLVQKRHLAQSMAVQGMSYMGQIGPMGRTHAPSISIGPFRGGWIDRGTQAWVPKVIPITPRCLHPSLSAKEKGMAYSVHWLAQSAKRKRLALWAISYGLFLLEAFDGSCSAVPHMAYGCPDHVECDRPQPVLGVHG